MHLERVLIVNETNFRPDEWGMPGWGNRHIGEPLKQTGIVDNIDNFYFGDYANSDEALIDYCIRQKPQAVLLSLQTLSFRKGGPTPDAVWKITHQLGIPTVAFWGDIHADSIAEVLEHYLRSVTLNVIWGADASSHKTLPLEGTNYVYTGLTFDESLFSRPEGVRDIPVGFLGSLDQRRSQWIAGLRQLSIPVYTAGGVQVNGKLTSAWTPHEEYLKITSRVKVMLNFSLIGTLEDSPIPLRERDRTWKALHRLRPRLKTWPLALVRNPLIKSKYIIPALRVILKKPRHQVRARVWEALWCRTFLLEEDNPVTSLYFEPYVDYVPFTTLKDLVDKIRYYLENEEERDRIRMHGRATVEKYYNARIYWENLFETMGIESATQNHHHLGEIWNKEYLDKWYLSHPAMER